MTFIAVVIATLAECQPFNHYWQVVPDPGSKCRQGKAQLITMGTSDIITDLLIVGFPIPIVLKSAMATKRRVALLYALPDSMLTALQKGLSCPSLRPFPHSRWNHYLPGRRCHSPPLRPAIPLPPRLPRDTCGCCSCQCSRPRLFRPGSRCKEAALPIWQYRWAQQLRPLNYCTAPGYNS